MSQLSLGWPSSYNPGPPEYLHAIGVISINIGSFEDTLDRLYFERTGLDGIPLAALEYRFYRQDEGKRLRKIRDYVGKNETNINAVKLIHNLIQYFQWCRDCRNHLLHASLYPSGLGGRRGYISLVKRISKVSEELGYIHLSLEILRDIADKIRLGTIHCINIRFYPLYRGKSVDQIPIQRRPFVPKVLPRKLTIPPTLSLTDHP